MFAAIVGQLGGNVAFQWSLGVIGLAFAVPLTTAAMIASGAVLGRAVLNEPITRSTLLSMLTLIVATCVLSFGAGQAEAALPALKRVGTPGYGQIGAGVLAASLSGLAYAVLGVIIRQNVTNGTPIASSLFLIATVGVVAVGSLAYARIGIAGIAATSLADYGTMMAAGVCNTAAFVCLTIALRETTVTYVNGLSAAQIAIASLLGVLLFSEPVSTALVLGVLLTVVGLLLMRARAARSTVDPPTATPEVPELLDEPGA
jgi:drug/metabolite transporter (DMT)-like permease